MCMPGEHFSCICNYIARIGYRILSMRLDSLDICVVPHEIDNVQFVATEAYHNIIASLLLIIAFEFY